MDELIHAREEWQTAAEPVTGPAMFFPGLKYIVVHYPGADWADMDFDNDGDVDLDDTEKILRDMQHMYLKDPNRGYSLGYNIAVDILGEGWEIRGTDIGNAANKGAPAKTGVKNFNAISISILIIQDSTFPATDPQLAKARDIIAEIRRMAGWKIPVSVHGDWDYTPCAGAGITAQVRAGLFEPYTTPPIPLPIEDDDMALHVQYNGPATADGAVRPELLLLQGKLIGFASVADRNAAIAATKAASWVISNPFQYDEVVRAFRA